MKRLSSDSETELIAGVKEAVELVDEHGKTPDEALEKVARENDWGQHMVRFAAHAYNTGKQTAQRETSDESLGKLAEFSIADPDKVVEAIWPKEVKSASVQQSETAVSSDYDASPPWLQSRKVTASREKAASADGLFAVEKKAEDYQPDPRTKMAKEWNRHLDLKRDAEEARFKAAVATEGVAGEMGRLREYFRKSASDRLPFHVVEHAVQTYFPKAAQALLDYAYEKNNMKEARAKDTPLPADAIDRGSEPFTMIKVCMDLGVRVRRLRGIHKEAGDAVKRHEETDLAPFGWAPQRRAQSQKMASRYLIKDDGSEKAAIGVMGSVLGGALGSQSRGMLDSALSGAPTAGTVEARKGIVNDLNDPRHEAELRQIRAQALLSEMMDDDVIGGHSPENVTSAYNEISQLAPQGSMQPLVLRSLLRRHLQGNVEPFEAQEVADIERKVAPQQNIMGTAAKNDVLE
jgi:hypothetical protein